MIKGKRGIIYKEISRIYFIIMSNKYHNSKIYAVKSNFCSEIYIGSTTTALCKRMVKHRCDAKQRPYLSKFYTYMNENGIENFYIELIEEYNCENVEQLRKREGEIIRQIGTLNERVAGRTKQESGKEWSKNNRDRINEQRNERRKENPEKTREDYKKWGALYRERHPEKIKAWKTTKVPCECGGSYTLGHKAEHMKSKKHLKLLGTYNEEEYKQSERANTLKQRYENNKQYRDEHKEEIKEWKKKNYEKDKNEILKKQKEYHQANKEARNEKKIIYREQHKEEINKKNAVKHICECGITYTHGNRLRHFKSQHHQNFINNQ